MSLGTQLFYALIDQGTIEEYFNFTDIEKTLRSSESDVFSHFDAYVKNYGEFPTLDIVEKDTGIELETADGVPQYYYDQLQLRHKRITLKKSINEVAKGLQQDPTAVDEAIDGLAECVFQLILEENETKVLDLKNAHAILEASHKKLWDDIDGDIKFGYDTLDNMSGGLGAGDLISLCGRPAAGKTYVMLYMALRMWKASKKPMVFFSMEMTPSKIIERLAAMEAKIPYNHIANAEITSTKKPHFDKVIKALGDMECSFKIVDGNLTSTVDDVYAMCRQLKPAVVFIDGAYLLRSKNTKLDKYGKVAENCELLKQDVATRLGVPVIASWQFNRNASKYKKKSGEEYSLDDIAYSDVIGQLSSLVLGMFEDDSTDSIDAKKRRKIYILKGRSGEAGNFSINWDFVKMNFNECGSYNSPIQHL